MSGEQPTAPTVRARWIEFKRQAWPGLEPGTQQYLDFEALWNSAYLDCLNVMINTVADTNISDETGANLAIRLFDEAQAHVRGYIRAESERRQQAGGTFGGNNAH